MNVRKNLKKNLTIGKNYILMKYYILNLDIYLKYFWKI